MTKQDLIELDDAELIDLGVASELIQGSEGGLTEANSTSRDS